MQIQVNNMQTQVINLNGVINSIQNMIDQIFGRLNDIEIQFKKIDEFTLTNLQFTNRNGIDSYTGLQGTWYRPNIL
jgi:hypothetical protein